MAVILVHSPKGGVGRTTVAANLAAQFARAGRDVTAIDFDPQQSLRLHFGYRPGVDLSGGDGGEDAARGVLTERGVHLIASGAQAFALPPRPDAKDLADLPARLEDSFGASDVVVIDLPADGGVFLDVLGGIASVELGVMLADAASMAMLPAMAARQTDAERLFLINQIDDRRRLSRDAMRLLGRRVGREAMAFIRRDEAICEALAMLRPVVDFAPESVGSYDFSHLARIVEHRIAVSADGVAAA